MQSTKSILPQTLLGKGATVRSIQQLTLCFALLVWAGPALGAKLGVPSTKYPTIQAAIDQAQPKDDIEVAPGTYYENIDFHGKAVRLYGRGGASATTIDGGGNGSVVTCANGETADTVLEGFTITGGSAYYGAGMYVYYSSPTVTNCTFGSNSARYGGGMYNEGSSPTVTDCTFSSNWAGSGGGMYNSGSSPTVTHCTFSSNWAWGYDGGGMCGDGSSSPTVTNCTFGGNWAIDGGGICGYALTVTNCTFSGNYGELGGGILGYALTVTNCAFVGNNALYVGGGIHGSGLTVTNCTFVGNTAGYDGGGICGSGLTVTNCILWSDSGGEIDYGSADVTVAYSDIQGGFPGEGNIDADPLLDTDGRLQAGSPCIDAGNSAAVPNDVTTDLDGDRRIRGASVDMGAYESSYKAKKTKP